MLDQFRDFNQCEFIFFFGGGSMVPAILGEGGYVTNYLTIKIDRYTSNPINPMNV